MIYKASPRDDRVEAAFNQMTFLIAVARLLEYNTAPFDGRTGRPVAGKQVALRGKRTSSNRSLRSAFESTTVAALAVIWYNPRPYRRVLVDRLVVRKFGTTFGGESGEVSAAPARADFFVLPKRPIRKDYQQNPEARALHRAGISTTIVATT